MYGRYPYQGQVPPPPQGGQGLTSNPGGFGQGVMRFIESYRGEQAAKKENAAKMFEKHAAMLAQGLPVDKKKMAKWAREADLHFDLDAPPPPPAQPPMPQAQGAAPGMPPGAMPPPPPAAMAGMQNFERGLPQRQSAEQAYMAANGGPSMAARAGMQNFEQGMPQRQGAEQAYMQANPRQPGFLKRLISGIGEATGVPQPPTQAQQMGVMKMLQEIEQRGQSSREMAGMQEKLKRRGMEIAVRLDEMLGKGKTLEDPEVMQLIAQAQMISGMGTGEGMGKGMSSILDSAMASKMAPNTVKAMSEAAAAKEEQKINEAAVKAVVTKHDNISAGDVKAALGGDFSALDESIGADKTAKMAEQAIELKENFANDKAVNAYLTALYSGASLEDLMPLMEALGTSKSERQESRDERRTKAAEQNARTSATNAQTAIKRLDGAGNESTALDAAGKALKKADGDIEAAKAELMQTLTGKDLLDALKAVGASQRTGDVNLNF